MKKTLPQLINELVMALKEQTAEENIEKLVELWQKFAENPALYDTKLVVVVKD